MSSTSKGSAGSGVPKRLAARRKAEVLFGLVVERVPMLARRSELMSALDRSYRTLGDIEFLLERVRSGRRVELLDAADAKANTGSPVIDLCNQIVAGTVEASPRSSASRPLPGTSCSPLSTPATRPRR